MSNWTDLLSLSEHLSCFHESFQHGAHPKICEAVQQKREGIIFKGDQFFSWLNLTFLHLCMSLKGQSMRQRTPSCGRRYTNLIRGNFSFLFTVWWVGWYKMDWALAIRSPKQEPFRLSRYLSRTTEAVLPNLRPSSSTFVVFFTQLTYDVATFASPKNLD